MKHTLNFLNLSRNTARATNLAGLKARIAQQAIKKKILK